MTGLMRPLLMILALAICQPLQAAPQDAAPAIWSFRQQSTPVLMTRAMTAFHSGDYRAARRLFRMLAVRAEPAAETMLGTMAARGQGMAANDAVAAAWLLRAARRGYAPAELALAHSFAEGKGVRPDPARALELAEFAAIQGLDEAIPYAEGLRQRFDLPATDD